MTGLLTFCLCVSLACTAIHVSFTWTGMIFNFTHSYLTRDMPQWMSKPLFDCLICMGSFWAFVFWCCYKPVTIEVVFAILITVGINTIIRCILNATTDDDGC